MLSKWEWWKWKRMKMGSVIFDISSVIGYINSDEERVKLDITMEVKSW